ncbi:hypothetical protein NQ317_017564 [Molorchus minor]|uniref:Uncharacterized protein n=1 Tax=Molorchus minor TaxID=1323400 RepID=A0ABQ9J8B7_9CUCU|nr:hypothetical protein NQ317_017564 [Molorchus minor]
MATAIQADPVDLKTYEFDLSFSNEETSTNKNVKVPDMARLSTPKPILHLGSSTEFQRQGTAIPKALYKPGTAVNRAGTGFKPTTSFKKPGTGFMPGTGFWPGTGVDFINRPMTAVRGAGYTSHGKPFDPLNQAASAPTPPLEIQKEDTPEERIKQQETKIMQLVEESCIAQFEGDNRKALTKAKEASNKERSLIRMQEQSGMGDHHNIDLTYAVLFNLGNQYAANELYTEALNTYQMIIKNRMFSNAHRLKINMGNIYFRQSQYQIAVKMYRMALDQVPSSQKNLRIKIMHNIALVFIRTGQWEEAVSSLEYIMSEQACHRAGLHLVVCCRALEDKDRMRTTFSLLLSIPLDAEEDEKYNLEQDSPEDALIARAIQNDDLHNYENQKRKDAEYCILTAAKLIAPLVEDTFSEGYDWCQGDYENAIKYGEIVKITNAKSANGYVNYGACLMAKGHLEEAITCFQKALEYAQHISSNFQFRFSGSLALLPAVVYQVGNLLELIGDNEAAADTYQQLLGLVPTDARALQKLGELYDNEGDKQQAHHYHNDSFRYYPANLSVIDWLGSYYTEMQVVEKALTYFEKAAIMQPNNPKWLMMVAGCHRRSGNMHKALTLYQEIHQQFPENAECLRFFG